MISIAEDWYRYTGKDPEDRQALKNTVLGSEKAFEILRNLLIARKTSLGVVNETAYDNPSWANLQAHRNGRQEEIDWLLNLLTFRDRKETKHVRPDKQRAVSS